VIRGVATNGDQSGVSGRPQFRAALALAAASVATLLIAAGCGADATPAASAKPVVTVAAVTTGSVPIAMTFSGTVKTVRTVQVISHVSGYIGKRYFTEGASVKRGDPLYRIDPRPFEANLDKVEAELASREANFEYWSREVERFQEARQSGAVSQKQLDTAVAKHKEARASVNQTRAQIENAKLDLGYTDIKSPFDARTQQALRYEGDLVDEYQDVLTTLVQMDPVHVIFNLSRRQLFEIRAMEAKGAIPPMRENARVELGLPDGSTYSLQGKLDFVSAQIDPTTDTVTLRAVVENRFEQGQESLVPGQYVPVRLVLGERSDAILIPKIALRETQAGQHVLVVDKDGTVERRKVEVGAPHAGQWVVKRGLEAGERVIVEGAQKVRVGTIVDPRSASAAKAPAETPAPAS
jgi:membrane fusion protein (multidrug efflux system)